MKHQFETHCALHAWDRLDDELPAGLRHHASGCEARSDEWDRTSPGCRAERAGEKSSRRLRSKAVCSRVPGASSPGGARGRAVGSALTLVAAGVVLAVGASWWFVEDRHIVCNTRTDDQASQPVLSAAPSPAVSAPRRQVESGAPGSTPIRPARRPGP
jgi:hypothetical protein